MSLNFGGAVLCANIFLILILITSQNELRQYNVALLMVERSPTIRFDLEHIGPAIDIAIQVNLNFFHSSYINKIFHFSIYILQSQLIHQYNYLICDVSSVPTFVCFLEKQPIFYAQLEKENKA
jgi:hypothetical protein